MKRVHIIVGKILILLLTSNLITGCRFNSTYNNREVDKQDGEKVVVQFYGLVKRKDYKETYKFFSKKFFDITDTQKLNQIFDVSLEELGNIDSFNIERWETQAIVGTDAKTDYVFLYNVKRAKFEAKETIILTKEKGEIKIVSYLINSDGFLKH